MNCLRYGQPIPQYMFPSFIWRFCSDKCEKGYKGMIPMFNSGRPCTYCKTNTKYCANIDNKLLYFCKLTQCKNNYLENRKDMLIKENSTVFKRFKVEEVRHAYGDKYAIIVKSENTGLCHFYLTREEAKGFNLDEEFEITLTKKVK